jgi:hypothetical protein
MSQSGRWAKNSKLSNGLFSQLDIVQRDIVQ